MPGRIISGGRTGADQAGWRTAQACGIPTGGRMPRGFLTEDGPRPERADLYGARARLTSSDPERTGADGRDSDGMPGLGRGASGSPAPCSVGWGASRPDPNPTTVASPGVSWPGPTRDRRVASSMSAMADMRAIGLCSGADPSGSGGTRLRCRPSCQAEGMDKTPAWEPVERGDVGTLALQHKRPPALPHSGPLAPDRPHRSR
jgi:Circularly permutated YpsA SLOG family